MELVVAAVHSSIVSEAILKAGLTAAATGLINTTKKQYSVDIDAASSDIVENRKTRRKKWINSFMTSIQYAKCWE